MKKLNFFWENARVSPFSEGSVYRKHKGVWGSIGDSCDRRCFYASDIKLLSENKEQQLLENIFKYFEEIVNSDDIHLINIFVITVLEILENDKLILENAKQYMGTKTTVLQTKADEELGRA